MGLGGSKEEFDFEAELAKQTEPQSVVVESSDDEMKDCGPIRRNILFKDRLVEVPWGGEEWKHEEDEEAVDTLWKSFQRGVRKFPERNMLGTRVHQEDGASFGDYAWTSYGDASTEAVEIGRGLLSLGVARQGTIGICSSNRAEWVTAALGFYSQGLVTVALYDTFGEEALEYIIEHAETQVVMCSAAKLGLLLQCIDKCPTMKTIVVFDPDERYGNTEETIPGDDVGAAKAKGVEVIGYSALRALGREYEEVKDAQPATAEELCFIMYTSGTTGMPKGVQLTHRNVMACIGGVLRSTLTISEDDIHLSYLPLAHIFETAVQGAIWGSGGSIGFFSGHVKRLTEDLGNLRPTIFVGVPRVFSKIYDKLMATIDQAGGLGRFFFMRSLRNDAYKVRRGTPLDRKSFGQKKVFAKVRGKLGLDRCRVIVTGAAPCPPYIMEFLRVVVNPAGGVIQGYGMTETSAAVTTTRADDHTLGHVGPPLGSAEIRLRDVPEMNYTQETNTGEVLARGPSIFSGYYKNEEATADALIGNGWIATGDIGRWNANGSLSIIDRKKNIFKLSQGEYIASEKLEGVYGRLSSINQCWVYGNSYKTSVLLVVVPMWNHWHPIYESKGWWGKDGPAIDANNPSRTEEYRAHFEKVTNEHKDEIAAILMDELKSTAADAKLRGFERIAGVIVEGKIDELGTGFNVDNDMLTPTFKLRRPFLLRTYEEQLRELYTSIGQAPKPDEKW